MEDDKRCDKCGKAIKFLYSEKKDKWLCVDAEPVKVLTNGKVTDVAHSVHFTSCTPVGKPRKKDHYGVAQQSSDTAADDIPF